MSIVYLSLGRLRSPRRLCGVTSTGEKKGSAGVQLVYEVPSLSRWSIDECVALRPSLPRKHLGDG